MDQVVRAWTEADVPAVRVVLQRSWEAAYGSFIPREDLLAYLELAYSDVALLRVMHDPEVSGYVGVHDGNLVAVIRVRDHRAENRTYVSSIYVIPEQQGVGWGRRLMSLAAQQALASGRRELWLGVMTQNLPALTWYRRHGFVAEHEEPFQMGRTKVQHLIGHLPVRSFLETGAERGGHGDWR